MMGKLNLIIWIDRVLQEFDSETGVSHSYLMSGNSEPIQVSVI